MGERSKKHDAINMFLDILIVAALFWLVICIFNLAFSHSVRDLGDSTRDVGMFSFELRQDNYADMIHSRHYNIAAGLTEDKKPEFTEYYALSEYYENAFLYKVYDAKGYTQRAEKSKSIMDEALDKAGDLKIMADKIDKNLSEF